MADPDVKDSTGECKYFLALIVSRLQKKKVSVSEKLSRIKGGAKREITDWDLSHIWLRENKSIEFLGLKTKKSTYVKRRSSSGDK